MESIYSRHYTVLAWEMTKLTKLDFLKFKCTRLLKSTFNHEDWVYTVGCTIGLSQLCFCSYPSNTIQLWALWDRWSAPSDVILAYNEVECGCKGPRGLLGKTGRTHGDKTPLGIIWPCFEFPKNSQRSWRSAVKTLMQHSIFTWGTEVQGDVYFFLRINVLPCFRYHNGVPFCGKVVFVACDING